MIMRPFGGYCKLCFIFEGYLATFDDFGLFGLPVDHSEISSMLYIQSKSSHVSWTCILYWSVHSMLVTSSSFFNIFYNCKVGYAPLAFLPSDLRQVFSIMCLFALLLLA